MMNWLKARQDIPLASDVTGRALPWVLAVLAFLAVLVLAGAFSTQQLLGRWQQGLEGAVSAQILPLPDEADGGAARSQTVLEILRSSPLVVRADIVSEADMTKLLSPWLGGGALPEGLPVPRLVDITLHPDTENVAPLASALAQVQGVSFDDHGRVLAEVRHLAWLVLAVAYAVVLLIGLATALIVWLLVRTGLAVHRDTVELLHMVGATDAYVARQFVRHVAGLTLQGSIIGAMMAGIVILLLEHYGEALQRGVVIPALGHDALLVAALVVPVVAVLLAMFTARLVALSLLRRMP